MNKKIFCVIPAFNEEKKIKKVINDVAPLLDRLIIVDDGSNDNTYNQAKEIKQEKIVVLKHLINRGQGAALETGNQYALKNGADIIVHFDADGQFLFSEIKDIVEPLQNDNYDIVFGSRFLEKKTNMPFFKKNILFPLARFINFFLGIKTTDPQSGFRAFSREALKK
jgi:glycosyltransferase involved in cell wall biosynthesis